MKKDTIEQICEKWWNENMKESHGPWNTQPHMADNEMKLLSETIALDLCVSDTMAILTI